MSSFPGACNFECKQPTWSESLTWGESSDGLTVTTPYDLTGHTITLRVKFASGAVSYSTAAGVTGTSAGVISWSLDTSLWSTGPIDFDLKATAPNGVTSWVLAGTVTVFP